MSFNFKSYTEIVNFIEKNNTKQVKIVAVSKNHPLSTIENALSFGVRIFGENRVQEAIQKFKPLKEKFIDLELHLTGSLQSNKVKQALSIFDVFQTLDREKLAREFLKFPDIIQKKQFFIQVNIGKESNKSGISPEEASDFINYCRNDLKLNISGLMCIPPQQEDPKPYFSLLERLAKQNSVACLSMGMSTDYKIGVLAGATHIRVGTCLFGKRK